jgi:hypothetical protein
MKLCWELLDGALDCGGIDMTNTNSKIIVSQSLRTFLRIAASGFGGTND